MPWKAPVLLCVLPWCAWATQQSGGRTYAVNDLIANAVEKNRELLALRQRAVEARGLLRQAGVRPAGSLQFGGATGRPLGTAGKEEYSAGYSRAVETGGKRDRRLEVAGKAVDLAEAELAERKLRLAIEIKHRYLDAAGDEARVAALERILGTYRESLRLIEARVREGDAAPLDGQLLMVEVSRTEAQKRTVSGRMQAALLDLRRLCGMAASEPIALAGMEGSAGAAAQTLADLRRLALERRADLRAARIEEERGAAEAGLTEAQGRADITLSAQYELRNDRIGSLYGVTAQGQPAPLRDRDNILSFGVSIPLLTRRRNLGAMEAASARAVGARTLRQHLEASIPLEVEAAWLRREAAAQSLEVLNKGVMSQSERNLEVVRQAYLLGQLRLLDVLQEQRRLIETRMTYIDAEAEARRASIELERAVGGDLP